MPHPLVNLFRAGWTLLRLIAVISSSIATILSSLLPLFIHTSLSTGYLLFMFVFLSVAAITVHGGLTHLFNDYADFLSGTDEHSPAILSGGSRVIQKELIPPSVVWKLGKWISIMLLVIAFFMAVIERYELAVLLMIGIWAAYSYSLPPLRLSYRPFLGECLCLFPAIFFLGLAGPWIILDTIPLWAYQNALINAFVCMAWVMVHHIPDMKADRLAVPIKRTSVVWFTDRFGVRFARFPALIYYVIAGLSTIWIFPERLGAALLVIVVLLLAIFFVIKLDPEKPQQVSYYERFLLLFAVIIAMLLGVF